MARTDGDTAESDSVSEELIRGLLDVVETDPSVTQRRVASELGIALGLVNASLKRCIRKGLVKVREAPRHRYVYYLTPRGMAEKSRLTANYLARSFSFFRLARTQCDDLYAQAALRGHRTLLLVGTGEFADIASLVARESSVSIVGGVPSLAELDDHLAFDAVMITDLANPDRTFDQAVARFGAPRVYVPELLRPRRRASAPCLANESGAPSGALPENSAGAGEQPNGDS